jgi:acetyl-CoA carboxylase biotin carboxyl carrier protein
MNSQASNGQRAQITALLAPRHGEDAARWELRSPRVGYFFNAPALGSLLVAGEVLGTIEVLGQRINLLVPPAQSGKVVEVVKPELVRKPVGYGECLVVLEPISIHSGAADKNSAPGSAGVATSQRFVTPTSGRYYARPAPDRPPFIQVGDVIESGKAIGLLEVMKTFSRIHYGGPSLPAKIRVLELLVADQDEISAGTPIFAYEEA